MLWAWQKRVFLGLIPAADALGLQLGVGKPRLGEHPVSCLLGDGAGGQRGLDYCLLQLGSLPAVHLLEFSLGRLLNDAGSPSNLRGGGGLSFKDVSLRMYFLLKV